MYFARAPMIDAADHGYKAVYADWIPLTVSILTFCARIFAKGYVERDRILRNFNWRRLGWDDHFMCAAVILQIGHATLLTVGWHLGMGQHIWTLSDHLRMRTILVLTIIKGFSVIPSCLARCSVALYQYRLLNLSRMDWRKYTMITVLIVNPTINIIALAEIYGQCGTHVTALWGGTEAKCLNPDVETNLGYAQSGINSLTDLVLSLFPLVILWGLQLPRKKKIQLYCVLSTSYLAFAASVIKTVEIGALSSSTDFTWNFVTLQIWVCIEVNVIIATGNFPAMLPLFKFLYRNKIRTPHTTPAVSKQEPLSDNSSSSRGDMISGNGDVVGGVGGTTNATPRKPLSRSESQELSILKVQDYYVSSHEMPSAASLSRDTDETDMQRESLSHEGSDGFV